MKGIDMSSVAELVKKEQRSQAERLSQYEAEKAAEKKKEDSKQFSAEVAYIIKQFEYNVFKLSSTNKAVAKFILDYKGRHSITRAGGCNQTMPGYITIKPFLSALIFEKDESDGRQHITKSSKFNKWKKALEDKFGVNIYIRREYTYRERFETFDDEIFQGVVASVQIVK